MDQLPTDSAALYLTTTPKGAQAWGVSEFLLADVFHAFTGKPHPGRPEAQTRQERYTALRARLEAQRARLTN